MRAAIRSSGGRRQRPTPARSTDPVTAEIIRGAMETIAYEMATHVSLTATTPILNQSNERNATILDASGALAALSVGIPQFMLSSTLPVRFALELFGPGRLHDGDVLVLDEYVSIRSAYEDYGVVLTGSLDALDLAVDEESTARRRAELRRLKPLR